MKDEEMFISYKYWIIFYRMLEDDIEVEHLVGFEENPDSSDIAHIRNELKTDYDLGMCEIIDHCDHIIVPSDIAINFYNRS